MSCVDDWKRAKAAFESATDKKKPGEKFLGAFRKSSGIESAAKGLDESLKKGDEARMLKAEAEYQKAMNAYNGTLDKALKGDKGDAYKSEVKKLQTAMDDILLQFVGQRNSSRKDLFEQLKKRAVELYEEMDRRFKVCQQDQRLAEGQAGDCDSALREVIDFCARNNMSAARDSAKKVVVAAKAMSDIHARVVKQKDDMRKHYNSVVKSWARDEENFADSESPVRGMRDKADAYNYAVDTVVETLTDLAKDGKQAQDDCTKALKGSLDATATYIAAGERLQKRAVAAVATFDQTYRDIGGEIDKANMDRMNGDESRDETVKQRLYGQARGKFKAQRGRITELSRELTRSKKDLQQQIRGFPDSIQSHRDFQPILEDLNKALGFISEIEQGLKAEAEKLVKGEKKLPG
jgi:hypothetical protein